MQNSPSLFQRSEAARIIFLTILSTLLIGIIATLVGIFAYNFIIFCGPDAGMGLLLCIPFGMLVLPIILLVVARVAARPAANFGFVRPLATMNVALLLMPTMAGFFVPLYYGVVQHFIIATVLSVLSATALSLVSARYIYTRVEGRRKQAIYVVVLFIVTILIGHVVPPFALGSFDG